MGMGPAGPADASPVGGGGSGQQGALGPASAATNTHADHGNLNRATLRRRSAAD